MNWQPLEKIANAVLYEGFLLYPYRKSAVKNRRRWHFGSLGPQGGCEPSMMQTQVLVETNEGEGSIPELELKIRFLQDEAERDAEINAPGRTRFSFAPIEFSVEAEREQIEASLYRFSIVIRNAGSSGLMASVHTLLAVHHGAFVSLIETPDRYQKAAASCSNKGTFPVLAGDEGERKMMLSSPIILYDYPKIAPESAGDFFDGTEMDEMLTLRVMTLSDEEKNEVRAAGNQGREILERTETLPPEHLGRMHGAIRNLRKASKLAFRAGDRVRLRPKNKADIFDIALDGKIAIVEAIERDFEDRVHVAVTVEDDPGRDFGMARQIGHRFFFAPEEVELV